MCVSCQICIKIPREGAYRAGERVTGILKYTVDTETEYQKATLSLIGKAKCEWTKRTGGTTHYYTGHETFLSVQLNILDKGSEETETLPVGAYEFPFQFTLPFEIPPSFKDEYSYIEYNLLAEFEKPSFFRSTKKFEKRITVNGYVKPTVPMEPVMYGVRKSLFKMFSCKEHIVNLQAQITKSFLTPGENAEIQLTVTNNTDTEISYVKTELIRKTSYHTTGILGSDTKFEEKTFDHCTVVTPPIPENEISKSTSIIPTLPEMYSLQHCKIIEIEYFIRLTAGLCFPHKNPSLDIPVVIGVEHFRDRSEDFELDNLDVEDDGRPGNEDSHWEVMNEVKK